jgi:hypothetical protein
MHYDLANRPDNKQTSIAQRSIFSLVLLQKGRISQQVTAAVM